MLLAREGNMKYNNLPTAKLFELAEYLRRFKEEYRWESVIIAKVLRRRYGIEMSVAELGKLEKKLEM